MNRILQKRVVPVAVLDDAADAIPLAKALLAGGLDIIEVTFRTPAAAESIRYLRRTFPDMLVGAGTLLTTAQVTAAVEAGAQFGVAPGINPVVVRHAQQLALPFIPGVMTPSDLELGLTLGCPLQKFFPAELAGGLKMLKALTAVYGHTGLKFIPLGGVSAANMAEYLAVPAVAAIGGTWLVERKLIADKQWPVITKLTHEALVIAGRMVH